jgi:hypothetical protein
MHPAALPFFVALCLCARTLHSAIFTIAVDPQGERRTHFHGLLSPLVRNVSVLWLR